jgi:uncharacterized protein with ATP-grasp and redox domains
MNLPHKKLLSIQNEHNGFVFYSYSSGIVISQGHFNFENLNKIVRNNYNFFFEAEKNYIFETVKHNN